MGVTLRVVAFDLDDTLTVSKSKIDQHIWSARAFRRRLTVAQKFYETRGAAGPA
jgi:FMN phosphatase YigB (HAD superfamily)